MISSKLRKEESLSAQQINFDRRPRRERRKEILELRRKKKKLERRLQHVLLGIEFDNETTTSFGNFHLLETFKQSIDLKGIISKEFTLKKGVNSVYSANDTLDFLIDSCALGHSRFEHTEALRFDPGYKDLKSIERYPSEKVFRDFFALFNLQYLKELCEINRRLIELRSQWEGPKEVWFDVDCTTLTLFGEQEGGEIRYNPRYRGRPSFELMLCFINETRDLLYVEICPKERSPKSEFKSFLEKCEGLLPKNYVLKGARIDKGFFGEGNIAYVEGRYLAYVAKVPLYPNIRHYIETLPHEEWCELDEFVSVTRKKLLLDSWTQDRYMDIRRSKIEKKTGQMMLPDSEYYRYEAVLVSELENAPEDNLSWYDKRGTAEDLIKEIKEGFAVDEASQHRLIRNNAYAFVKVITYNLFQFFKAVAMPESHHSWQIQTVRRKLINVPGNILGPNRFHRVKLAPCSYLKILLPLIQEKLRQFLWFVANGFNRCEFEFT